MVTAKDVIKNVCIYLGKEEILSSCIFEEGGEQLSSVQQEQVNKMINCLNFVTEELSMHYLPLLKTKQISLNNGVIMLADIDENLQEIVAVKTLLGKNLKYGLSVDKMICLANKVEITYKVYPNKITLEDKVEDFGGRMSARIFAYGVASEYCFLEMLYDDASLWESRYKNAILMVQRKKSEISLKKRRWI